MIRTSWRCSVADHKKIKSLFKYFEKLKENDGLDDEKTVSAQQICNEFRVYAEIDEEIFYPAVREVPDNHDLMGVALAEHVGAKEPIARLEGGDLDDHLYDVKVTVPGEQIDRHVKEDENEMFSSAKKAKVDTLALGAEMTERTEKLIAESDSSDEGAEPEEGEAVRSASTEKGSKRKPLKLSLRNVQTGDSVGTSLSLALRLIRWNQAAISPV